MITLQNVSKSYLQHRMKQVVLQSVSLHISKGEVHGLIGVSGAGKSTLLRMMNLLEKPDQGLVTVNGQELTALEPRDLRNARKSIGMIFQHYNLLANKTVFDNVAIPLKLSGKSKQTIHNRVNECLRFVGLLDKAQQFPAQLSGGQKQRVAIARALVNNPSVLLCDEPTSSLDQKTTFSILKVLETINKELGVTIVIVSHEMDVVRSICHRVTVVDKGKLVGTVPNMKIEFAIPDEDPKSLLQQLHKNERDAYA